MSRIVPWSSVPDDIASVRIPPRMIPMQGVQPTAKIAPRPNEASQPPRWLTNREPSRSPSPSDGPPRDIEPVAVASDAEAPASSGRHVRSSTEIRMIPARLSPMSTRITPPITRRAPR